MKVREKREKDKRMKRAKIQERDTRLENVNIAKKWRVCCPRIYPYGAGHPNFAHWKQKCLSIID